jgi:hypothetical protein
MEHGHEEAPNFKYQIPNKFQSPTPKQNLFVHLKLEFGAYFGFGICDLGF